MLDKTKWAPKPPPEPVITGSLAPEPKGRGRKRTKKQYFTPDTDAVPKSNKPKNASKGDKTLRAAKKINAENNPNLSKATIDVIDSFFKD